MDHLLGNEHAGFAGDEHDAAPLLVVQHPLQIMPGQTHPAHHVDFEHPGPVGILDIEKALRLVDAEIVDEDVDFGKLRSQRGAAFSAAEIDRRRVHFG